MRQVSQEVSDSRTIMSYEASKHFPKPCPRQERLARRYNRRFGPMISTTPQMLSPSAQGGYRAARIQGCVSFWGIGVRPVEKALQVFRLLAGEIHPQLLHHRRKVLDGHHASGGGERSRSRTAYVSTVSGDRPPTFPTFPTFPQGRCLVNSLVSLKAEASPVTPMLIFWVVCDKMISNGRLSHSA